MSNKTENAYQTIKSKILDNIYQPSQRLIENQLSQELDVSRNIIRKVLARLESEDLVVLESNKGAYVKSLSLEEVLNLLEIRLLLEVLIAKSAVEYIDSNELDELKNILIKMNECINEERFEDYSQNNKKFHNIIYNVSRKPEAVSIVKRFKTQLVRHQFRTIIVAGRNTDSIKEHTDIYNALERRNKQEVEKAITTHIGNVSKTIKVYYQYLL